MLESFDDCTRRPPVPARIGVGYNGSLKSAAALAVGRQLAALYGAQLQALEVVCPALAVHEATARVDLLDRRVDSLLRQARERLADLDGVEGCAVYGIAKEELTAFGEEVDLLVIGPDGRGPERSPCGVPGTAAYLQRHARCPVLVVARPALAAPPRLSRRHPRGVCLIGPRGPGTSASRRVSGRARRRER